MQYDFATNYASPRSYVLAICPLGRVAVVLFSGSLAVGWGPVDAWPQVTLAIKVELSC